MFEHMAFHLSAAKLIVRFIDSRPDARGIFRVEVVTGDNGESTTLSFTPEGAAAGPIHACFGKEIRGNYRSFTALFALARLAKRSRDAWLRSENLGGALGWERCAATSIDQTLRHVIMGRGVAELPSHVERPGSASLYRLRDAVSVELDDDTERKLLTLTRIRLGDSRRRPGGAGERRPAAPLPPIAAGGVRFLSLGSLRTQWVSVDESNGTLRYSKLESCLVEPPTLPGEVERARAEWEEKSRGNPDARNGRLYGLLSHATAFDREELSLEADLSLYVHDYYTFKATVASQGGRRIPHGYDPSHGVLVPHATGVGMAIFAVTADNFAVFARRREGLGARGNELDVSVVEGLSPVKDGQTARDHVFPDGLAFNELPDHEVARLCGPPDLHRAARRACEEELCLASHDAECIELLALGVDMEFYQWNFLGYAKLHRTFAELAAARGRRSKPETAELIALDADPNNVLEWLSKTTRERHEPTTMWSCGLAASYYGLVRHWGYDSVSSVLHHEG